MAHVLARLQPGNVTKSVHFVKSVVSLRSRVRECRLSLRLAVVSNVYECVNVTGLPGKIINTNTAVVVNTFTPSVSGALTVAPNIEIQSRSVNVMPQSMLEAFQFITKLM
jgi:hypothetical protein